MSDVWRRWPGGERMAESIDAVRDFWEAEACGERYGSEHENVRYQLEPHISEFADFAAGSGKRVLEIGVGMGADFVRWAQAGAQVTGIDLTERAASLARRRLAQRGLPGEVRVGDAETLPFDEASFDVVYSWGVLHHTPHPDKALAEALRVLAPGGRLKVMLYHRHSWVALAAWMRFGFLRARPTLSLRGAVAHIESPGTQAFTPGEVRTLVRPGLARLDIQTVLTHWDRRCAPGIARVLGDRFGWFMLVDGVRT